MPPAPTSADPPRDLVDRLQRHGQEHLLRWWPELDPAARAELLRQIQTVDLDRIDALNAQFVHASEPAAPEADRVRPIPVNRLPRTDGERAARRRAAEAGERALQAGEVAVVLVAGGQGTRLGFEGPKGTFPIGPVSAASLFQIHAEKVVALGRRYGRLVPLYVMTSPDNHDVTLQFFADHGHFGLDHVRFFVQGQMPAVERQSGKVLLAEKGQLSLSPDGHGGTLAALARAGTNGGPSCLAEIHDRGIRTIFYFQVDNPLVQVCDPVFLGLHRQAEGEVSFKVVEKLSPEERVGLVVQVDDRPRVIEYSDLPLELAELREPDGGLELWSGSIAVHIFELAFIDRLVSGAGQLPFHRALKKVPFVDADGRLVSPTEPNAVKFEQFIFDALPLAERWSITETDRALEFEPLKNSTGNSSPATVRQRLSDLFANWLERAGATVPRRADGSVPFGIEISPLFALDASEVKAKLEPGMVVEGPLYLR